MDKLLKRVCQICKTGHLNLLYTSKEVEGGVHKISPNGEWCTYCSHRSYYYSQQELFSDFLDSSDKQIS